MYPWQRKTSKLAKKVRSTKTVKKIESKASSLSKRFSTYRKKQQKIRETKALIKAAAIIKDNELREKARKDPSIKIKKNQLLHKVREKMKD